jgi:hypothetical protein
MGIKIKIVGPFCPVGRLQAQRVTGSFKIALDGFQGL